MSRFSDSEFDELMDKMRNPGRYSPEYAPLNGEPSIFPELEFAVSNLVKFRYRNYGDWTVFVEYRFTDKGILTRTYVRSEAMDIRFIPEEAIAIAASLVSKHFNQ